MIGEVVVVEGMGRKGGEGGGEGLGRMRVRVEK